jgi:hypothetical protein
MDVHGYRVNHESLAHEAPLELLHALTVAFNDAHTDAHRVADIELRYVLLHVAALDLFYNLL